MPILVDFRVSVSQASHLQEFEEERIVNEREKCLEENRQKEAELQAKSLSVF